MSTCYDPIGRPIPCGGWSVYNSGQIDPQYQWRLTIAWLSILGFFVLLNLPHLVGRILSFKFPKRLTRLLGLYEYDDTALYRPLLPRDHVYISHQYSRRLPRPISYVVEIIKELTLRRIQIPRALGYLKRIANGSLPSFENGPGPSRGAKVYFHLTNANVTICMGIIAFVLVMMLQNTQLESNPNRFGYISLSLLPPLFLLSSKSLLGPVFLLTHISHTSINFAHRLIGRIFFPFLIAHAALWTKQQESTMGGLRMYLAGQKQRDGVCAVAFLLLIILSSLKPIRTRAWGVFYFFHFMSIPLFLYFAALHTSKARPWCWSVGFIWTWDLGIRVLGSRFRYVEIEAVVGGLTKIKVDGFEGGWRSGQHINVRLLYAPFTVPYDGSSTSIFVTITRIFARAFTPFESHPFSIGIAPPTSGVLSRSLPTNGEEKSDQQNGFRLYAKSQGANTWTGRLWDYAYQRRMLIDRQAEEASRDYPDPESREMEGDRIDVMGMKKKVTVLAHLSAPRPSSLPATINQETILLVACGSGMGFILGVLDEIVGNRIHTQTGGVIEVIWVIKAANHISWFEEELATILKQSESHPGFQTRDFRVSLKIYISNLSNETTTTEFRTDLADFESCSVLPSRPLISLVVLNLIEHAITPCGNCWPVCLCGEGPFGTTGLCSNSAEGCSSLGKPQNCCKTGATSLEKVGMAEVIQDDCCSTGLVRVEKTQEYTKRSCCQANTPENNFNAIFEERIQNETGVLRVRTGGVFIAGCGPEEMTAELGNAILSVSVAKRIRVGGIEYHEESFTI